MRQNQPFQMGLRSFLGLAGALALGAVAAACSGDPFGPATVPPGPTVAIPPDTKLLPPPVTEPEELPGVDTSELNKRERSAYWRWVSQLYAPCPEVAVSIAACVKEERACAECVPAARFLAARARAGTAQNEAIAAFRARFGLGTKKVDLADSPARGPLSAPVTIIVWSDFECPACGYAVPFLDDVLEKHASDVRLIHKLYPLKSHPHSRQAARAAIAAKRQGKYWEMEKLLFSHQKHLEDGDLEEYARNAGLEMTRFASDFTDSGADAIIERDRAEADKQGLSGTPFILINGREFDLSFFKLDRDLESWIAAEIEIRKKGEAPRATVPPPALPVATTAPVATASPTASASASAAPVSSSAPGASATPVSSNAPSTSPAASGAAASNGKPISTATPSSSVAPASSAKP